MLYDQDRRDLITVAQVGLESSDMRIRFKAGEGMAGWVAANCQSVICNDPASDPRFVGSPDQSAPITAIMVIPLYAMSLCAGVLNVHSSTRAFGPDELDLCELLAALISAEIQRRRMSQLILTDSLTQIGNRKSFDQTLKIEAARAMRYGNALSIAGIDVDHMKALNEQLGERGGDIVLRQLAVFLRGLLRTPDHLFRIGGDEFGVLLPETDARGAANFGERARSAIAAWKPDGLAIDVSITVSIGTTGCADSEDLAAVIRRLDEAELAAKQSGRNRVVAR